MRRGEGVAEASAAQAAANALFSGSDASTSRSAAATTGGNAPAGPQPQQQQLSRKETVAQVGALLQSTRSMTARLDAQLEELRLHGWNAAAPRE